ncbi:hypothetical protein [Streptomyces sp. NRRL F-2580]|nr:hypothetical protein [Streptomyces sp. NRRL F-2580]
MSPDPEQLAAEDSLDPSPDPSPELQARAESGMARFLESWEADAEEPR